MMSLEEFEAIPLGAIFRIVTTKYHNVENGNPELTFVCVKGDSQAGDWAIYYGFADQGVMRISTGGTKLISGGNILSILPCVKAVLERYRL